MYQSNSLPNTTSNANQVQQTPNTSQYKQIKVQYQSYLSPASIKQLKKIYKHGVCHNHHKQLLVVDQIGQINMAKFKKILADDEAILAYTLQRMIQICENMLNGQNKIVWVLDLSGKIMQLASTKILKMISRLILILQECFPNTLKKLVLVNVPMLFESIWVKIKQQISKQTQKKIIMIGSNVNQLYQHVNKELLPEFLGGSVPEEQWLYQQTNHSSQDKQQQEQSQEEEEEEIDLQSLKQALSNLNHHSFNNKTQSVAQTPLNTEADQTSL